MISDHEYLESQYGEMNGHGMGTSCDGLAIHRFRLFSSLGQFRVNMSVRARRAVVEPELEGRNKIQRHPTEALTVV
jgi:hypothetical protein